MFWYEILIINKLLKLEHTSMIAAWTLGFWNAIATSGLAIIFDMTSSGLSPIWSDESQNVKCSEKIQGERGGNINIEALTTSEGKYLDYTTGLAWTIKSHQKGNIHGYIIITEIILDS